MTARHAVPALCALLSFAIGLAVFLGWAFEVDALKTVLPGLVPMKANTAFCLVFSGLALLTLAGGKARRAGRLAAAAVLVIALATFVEYLLGLDLGIDQWLFQDLGTFGQPFPGRMARETSIGFIAASLALCFGTSVERFPGLNLPARALAMGTGAFGAVGVIAYLLKFEFLIAGLPYTTVDLHTAFGFTVLGAGLFAVLQPREPLAEDRRIAGLAALLLVLAASATGLVSFATIGRQVHVTLAQGLTAALDARTAQITTNVALRTTRAEIITTRPNLLKHLRLLQSDPSNPEYRAVVQGVLESFLAHGFSGIAVNLDSSREEVASAGEFITWPKLEVRIKEMPETSLLWHNGIYLRHRLLLRDAQGPLGTVLAEQLVPGLTDILRRAKSEWTSAELLICAPRLPMFQCFPSRFQAIPFVLAPVPAGVRTRLVSRALAEGKGFGDALDYRGQHVLGAYERLDAPGLVAVLKVDAEEIYAPAVRSFKIAVLLTFTLAWMGALFVQHRVRPLATALEDRVRERTAELEAARAEVTDLYENAPDMYLSIEAGSARILRCNETLLKATGYTREEVLGKTIFDLFQPETVANARQFFMTFQEHGEMRNAECRVVRKDGSMIDVSVNATAVHDAEGRIRYSRSSWRDISEQKHQEARFRTVVEASPSGMIVVDSTGRIVLVNTQAERLFGYAREELIGEPVEVLVPERFRAGHAEHQAHFRERPETRTMGAGRDLYGRRRDGSEFAFEIGLSHLGEAGNKMVLATIVDISERIRLERELRAKELSRVFLDAAPVMMWMTDENFRALMFNGEWLRFSGRSHEEELAVPWNGARIHPEDRDRCLAAYDLHLKAHTRLAHEYRLKDCHGNYRWIEEVTVPRFDLAGRYEGHVGCCVDVTERRDQAERLAAALAEKTVLLQEIHHRVKNNLQVIGSLLSLQADTAEDPAVRAALSDGQSRVKSMALLHQLFYEQKDFGRVDIGGYLRQLARLALTSADAQRIAVKFDLAPVYLDLQRAVPCGLLVNELLTNACKHAFPDGRKGTLRLELHREDGGALLTISDDGIGLPETVVLGHTKSLGLQLVPLLAEQLGGQIKVERGAGTRFELRFRTAA